MKIFNAQRTKIRNSHSPRDLLSSDAVTGTMSEVFPIN